MLHFQLIVYNLLVYQNVWTAFKINMQTWLVRGTRCAEKTTTGGGGGGGGGGGVNQINLPVYICWHV